MRRFLPWLGWIFNALLVTIIFAVAHMGPLRMW